VGGTFNSFAVFWAANCTKMPLVDLLWSYSSPPDLLAVIRGREGKGWE